MISGLGELIPPAEGGSHEEVVIDTLRPIQQRYKAFMDDPATLNDVLRAVAEAARRHAAPMLDTVKERVGFP
jgi:tryptophanyl-tRNA synthetase